ncbi:linoleate diol synthase [Colletotrichum karsti]|uniref:Linoleate diol synthase n=1 Tax=Colletotrichum karsti TaxID=1095194 RepID=A0A9P6LDX5_9PEZI|nr:linoleate diol synthase [Colletotrichum karsti]KAF9869401.1 linoleate diol synthase [Colletotrichum karsti]
MKRGSHSSASVEHVDHDHGRAQLNVANHNGQHGVPRHKPRRDVRSKGDQNYGKYDAKVTGSRKDKLDAKRPLPVQFGNGTYPMDKSRPGVIQHFRSLQIQDVKTLAQIIKSKLKLEKIQDDKTMIMERTIQIVAKLPHKSKARDILTNVFIEELWGSLEHPPLLYLDDNERKYKYRQADGSCNNPLFPMRGAAGQPYARSVKPRVVTLGALPDPELVFDSVMARRENGYKEHPNQVSSILWYWATIIIHDLFWTDRDNSNISNTSAYLDLSPLYGSNQKMQRSVRTLRDGKLKPDAFADGRLNVMPPGVCVLLIMFNRFHNHVAENLAAINEGNRFPRPSPGDEKAVEHYDEELFQTARLVTCGLYINITLVDYVRNIVNLNRTNSTWTLDPRQEAGKSAGTPDGAEIGTGNVNSAEFNLCYRWHSCISDNDDKWIQKAYDKKLETVVSTEAWDEEAKKMMEKMKKDPGLRCFGNLTRDKTTNKFNDDELVDCIKKAIKDCAGSFGARNVPMSMRNVEVAGIKQAREWNVAGLNEFRKHFGLKPYDTFEEINPDTDVAESLRHLYQHPDNVELYPGLVCESAKQPMSPGVGIAPTYTISRVVLSDAVCLVRGDRYYTIDYTPRHLTNWGFKEVEYDLNVNHGCVFYKLFLNAFPNHFKSDSVYAHYPMVTPPENVKILEELGRYELFSDEEPEPGQGVRQRQMSTSPGPYSVTWNHGLEHLIGNKWTLGEDPMQMEHQCIGHQSQWEAAVKDFYFKVTTKLLREKSYTLGVTGRKQTQVDIIRDVGNLAHVHFVSQVFNLPLKIEGNPKGIYTEHELYQALACIHNCVFLNNDAVKAWPLRQEARKAMTQLSRAVEKSVSSATGFRIFGGGSGVESVPSNVSAYGASMMKELARDGSSASEITWNHVLPTIVSLVPGQAKVFAEAVNACLDDPNLVYEIHRVARSGQGDDRLLSLAMQCIHSSGVATADDGLGAHACLTAGVSRAAMVGMFRALFQLDAVERPLAPMNWEVEGAEERAVQPQGILKKVKKKNGHYEYLTEDWGQTGPFPMTMKIRWRPFEERSDD